MSDPSEQEVMDLLKEHDAVFVRKAKHGDLYKVMGGVINLPGTASDRRAWKNTLGDLRRIIRGSQVGVVEGADEEEEEEEMLSPEQIASMGVHVQRKRVVTETTEVTLSLEAIAKLLGVWEEGAKVSLSDFVEGSSLTMTLTTNKEEA